MDGYPDDQAIQLSAVQHVAFCERQCYLIHVEQLWSENCATVKGKLAHERVDSEEVSYTADGIKQVRSLMLCSHKYGLSGRADLIEFDPETGRVFPVEYKIGRPKENDCDKIQLCAQAFCLEEMLHIAVPQGAIYYGATRQRILFELTDEIRNAAEKRIRQVHELFLKKVPPPPVSEKEKCKNCSLHDLCMPELSGLASPEKYVFTFSNECEQE